MPTQESDIKNWLGDAYNELTEEQIGQFTTLVETYELDIEFRRPHYGTDDYYEADYADDNTAAWIAALEIVEGTFDLTARGRAYRDARAATYQGAIMSTIAGTSEVAAADQAGITRKTLRKQLGK